MTMKLSGLANSWVLTLTKCSKVFTGLYRLVFHDEDGDYHNLYSILMQLRRLHCNVAYLKYVH